MKKIKEKKMTNEQVVSAITGKSVEQIRDRINKEGMLFKKFMDFMDELGKVSKTDYEFVNTLTSYMATMMYPLPKNVRQEIIVILVMSESQNMNERISSMIEKFKK